MKCIPKVGKNFWGAFLCSIVINIIVYLHWRRLGAGASRLPQQINGLDVR